MGRIRLEPRCPKEVNGISIDPNPNWNFNDLLSELNTLESKLINNASDPSLNPKHFTKTAFREVPRIGRLHKNEEKKTTFVMRVDDDEMDESDGNDGIKARSLVPASRFTCDDMYFSHSDSSDEEEMQQLQVTVMDKNGVVEGAFLELTHEHQIAVKEDIRSQLAAVEMQLVAEKEKSTSALVQVEKIADARRQTDRKLDLHYQRKIAEALDNHLTNIQRDHEHRSQIEERKIRDDAALEEAKRKEKALQEEKIRQQRAAEEEAASKRAQEERRAAHEAERLAKEASEKMMKGTPGMVARSAQTGTNVTLHKAPSTTPSPTVSKGLKSTGNLIKAGENALKLEKRRLSTYKELEDKNQLIISRSNVDFRPKDKEIARRIKQISGSMDSVRSKAKELLNIFNDPAYPQSVTVAMFANKVISFFCDTSEPKGSTYFACSLVIVYVSAQVPAVMDCLLAEFHKASIYTVPKHISYSKTAFETTEAYFKTIGYKEEDGRTESAEKYLKRLGSMMKLYGALVQTEAQGVQNLHGLGEGWAWLARFLNFLPPNVYTAVALEAFLTTAGFVLHRNYKVQFRKIMNIISKEFVPKLKTRDDPNMAVVTNSLQDYVESQKFLQEPEGWRLQGTLLSRAFVPDAENNQGQIFSMPSRNFTYQRW